MRIDAYNQISKVYQTNKTVKTQSTAKVSSTDKLEISALGRDMQIAKQAVANSPDIRSDKVDTFKKSIEDGTYEVSADSFAEKLLENMNQ